jgi:uncharacterized membrane protein HdeD (DUF308 family)
MENQLLKKIAGISMLITGIGHTTTHFILQNSTNPHSKLISQMAETVIKIGSEVSVLDFHNGFSTSMGILLMAFGITILRNNNKTSLWIHSVFSGFLLITSIFYFPAFVIILMSTTFVSLIINLLTYDY